MRGDEMTKQERAKFYKSKKWKDKCKVILKRDGYRCQLSKRYGKQVDAEIVHHIYPLSKELESNCGVALGTQPIARSCYRRTNRLRQTVDASHTAPPGVNR